MNKFIFEIVINIENAKLKNYERKKKYYKKIKFTVIIIWNNIFIELILFLCIIKISTFQSWNLIFCSKKWLYFIKKKNSSHKKILNKNKLYF